MLRAKEATGEILETHRIAMDRSSDLLSGSEGVPAEAPAAAVGLMGSSGAEQLGGKRGRQRK